MNRLIQIPGFIPSNIERYPNYLVKGSALFCGAAAVELALRTLASLTASKKIDNTPFAEGERSWYVITNLAGSIFYGLCAANIVTHSAVAGSILFTAYSFIEGGNLDACYASQVIHGVWQASFGPSFTAARKWAASFYPSGDAADAVAKFSKTIFSREAMHVFGIVVTALFAYRVAPLLV